MDQMQATISNARAVFIFWVESHWTLSYGPYHELCSDYSLLFTLTWRPVYFQPICLYTVWLYIQIIILQRLSVVPQLTVGCLLNLKVSSHVFFSFCLSRVCFLLIRNLGLDHWFTVSKAALRKGLLLKLLYRYNLTELYLTSLYTQTAVKIIWTEK